MLANLTAVHLVSSNLQSKMFDLKWMGRVFPRCAKLLPWVLRICGRAEGGVRSGEGGNKEVLVREVSSSDFCTFVWGVLERKYLALVDFFVLHGRSWCALMARRLKLFARNGLGGK